MLPTRTLQGLDVYTLLIASIRARSAGYEDASSFSYNATPRPW